MEYDPIDEESRQRFLGETSFEKEKLQARENRSRRLEGAWNMVMVIATCTLVSAATLYSVSPSSFRHTIAEELNTDHKKEFVIALVGTYNSEYPDEKKPTGYSSVVSDAKTIVEPHYEYKLKVVGTHLFDNCAFEGQYVTGGGVWDSMSSLPPASSWSPRGKAEALESKEHEVIVKFPAPGTYKVEITCQFETGHVTTLKEIFHAYYIRRELRDLSKRDKEAFLDTFLLLEKTPTKEGIKKYGAHYRSLAEFEVMHLRAAGDREVDHIHDGLGGVTQHSAMTMEFELAMQSVEPRLAVPYWDYTIDSVKIEFDASGKADVSQIFKNSILFTKNFFGETDGLAHRVTQGRFSHVEIPRDYSFDTNSPYGFLRAPWNINPSKFVTRYHKVCGEDVMILNGSSSQLTDLMWPTCASHFKFSNTDEEGLDTWRTWAYDVMYVPHGPVHSWVGGVGGTCDTFDALATETGGNLLTSDQVTMLKHVAFALLKTAWRAELINTPEYCAEDTPVSECMWQCSEDIFVSGSDANILAASYLRSFAGITLTEVSSEELDRHKILRKVFCETPFWPGDHLEAASPIEASFWPIHPTLDRLLQYKQIVRPFSNKTWESSEDADCVASESGCEGHHAYDITYFKSVLQTDDGTYHSKHMTNLEVRESADPTRGYSLPYLYNHFSWSHCSSVGVYFKSVAHAYSSK